MIFKEIAIMHGKGEFALIKCSICNIQIEGANNCNNLQRSAVQTNGLIAEKLKRDLKYRGYVYFELIRPIVTYKALNCLKSTQ